jgi:hypothetical protein
MVRTFDLQESQLKRIEELANEDGVSFDHWISSAIAQKIKASKNKTKPLRVSEIKHILTEDVDVTQRFDVKILDEYVNTCVTAAKDALQSAVPPGFSDFNRDILQHMIEGLRSAHESIRKLLREEPSASSVDAMTIARLQVETLYSFCFMLQDAKNVSLFLKGGWKKQYIRFLMMREEWINIPRSFEFLNMDGVQYHEKTRKLLGVSDAEKLTIESEELGTTMPTGIEKEVIRGFPTPGKIIDKIVNPDQKSMLERLYPEYQWLCSFAHGDQNASFCRTVLDQRSPQAKLIDPEKRADLFQRHIAEDSVLYSAISAVQAATELAVIYPHDVELMVKVSTAWSGLTKFTLLSRSVWERRAKKILPLISV